MKKGEYKSENTYIQNSGVSYGNNNILLMSLKHNTGSQFPVLRKDIFQHILFHSV